MKTSDFFLLAFLIASFTLYSLVKNAEEIKQSENRIIEAIEKQKDSINAVEYLNRETIKK